MEILPQLILIIVLILINAFFSCSEIALVSVNKTKLNVLIENEDKRAIKLRELIDSPSKMLSTIQVAITLSGFFASASAAVSLSEGLDKFLINMGVPYAHQASVFMITMILSYITLVFGELVPKKIGLQNPLKISLAVVDILTFISAIFTPIILFLSYSTNIIIYILGLKDKNESEDLSKEEMIAVLNTGDLNDNEKELLENVIEFDEKLAREIMIPRPSVFAISKGSKISEILKLDNITRYSRVPIYDNDLDDVIGVLHIKDLILIDDKNLKVEDIMKEAYFVPDTKKINDLFKEMKSNNNHMAILIDEYGGVSGIVTLEDLLEEIVGNITDEYDKINNDIIELGKNKFLINGELSINDLNDYLGTNLHSEYYDTVAGLVIENIGFIPEDNQKIDNIIIDNIVFTIFKTKNKKIEKVMIIRKDEND